MVLGVLSGSGWWQHAEQVVAPRAGAVEEQEPRCLEVVQGRDLIQKSLVAGPGLAEVVSLVFWCAKGGSEDSEPSLLGRECRVSDPNVCSKRFHVGRRDARKVPDSGFATVELDVRVVVEVVCQKIVHGFHPMWLDHCVNIIEVSIKAFPFLKLGMDGLDCSALPQGKQCGHEGVALLHPRSFIKLKLQLRRSYQDVPKIKSCLTGCYGKGLRKPGPKKNELA